MTRYFLLILTLCVCFTRLNAQCSAIDITVPDEICLQSNIQIENNTTAASFEWDLCPFDLLAAPSVTALTGSGIFSAIDITVATDNGVRYAFAVDASTNSLLRLAFSSDTDTNPMKSNFGNVDNLLDFPNAISIVNEGGTWLGLIANAGNNKILLLNFGNSLQNTPDATELYSRGGGGFVSIAVTETSLAGRTLIIGEYNSSQVTIVNYPQGFLEPSDFSQTVPINGSRPIDLQVIQYCGNWTVVVLSFDDRKLYRMDFGTSLISPPSVTAYSLVLGFDPYRLSLVREGDTFYAFTSSTSGGISRLTFGTDLATEPSASPLNTFGVLANSRAFWLDSYDGEWQGLTINFSGGEFYRLLFKGNCGVTPAYSSQVTPGTTAFSVAGDHKITVASFQADGTLSVIARQVTVKNQQAPEFTIQSTNACVNHEVIFGIDNVVGDIVDYEWDFGDGNFESVSAPSHSYATTGTFEVLLWVLTNDQCSNQKSISVAIFAEPVTNFSMPSASPQCTNQLLDFDNTSSFDPGSAIFWNWYVNGNLVSDQQDLRYAFASVGPHTVTLRAGIPGCDDEISKSLSPLIEGPAVDFSFQDKCFGQRNEFLNTSSGNIQSFQWNFGDGENSSELSPTHTFNSSGTFTVTLSTTSEEGCVNDKSKSITIYSNPITDFKIDDPPNSCSGSTTNFTDLTPDPSDSNISRWQWDFGDSGIGNTSTQQSPSHVFNAAGNYNVNLTTTTDFGCRDSLQKIITVLQSPAADFTNTVTCKGLPVDFTATGSNIDAYYWEIGTSYYVVSNPTHTFNTSGVHQADLTVTGTNGCASTYSKDLTIPVILSPDFSVSKNCINENAVFTDITTGADAVALREWDFGGLGSAFGSPATFQFSTLGNKTIKLKVTGESGCEYTKSKSIAVTNPPVTAFTALPESGAAPLDVQFVNTSTSANQYAWKFQDGTGATSFEVSPLYRFQNIGEFLVTLTASNNEGCEKEYTKRITVVAPLPDVHLKILTVSENPDGSLKVIITIHNKGNTVLRNLPVEIDISGNVSLTEIIETPIAPASMSNFVLGYGINQTDNLIFLCASAELPNDVVPEDNRICTEFQDQVFVFHSYPNPVKDILHIEWISPNENNFRITLADALGRIIFESKITSLKGLNQQTLNAKGLQSGIYFLHLSSGPVQKIQRIFVSGEN